MAHEGYHSLSLYNGQIFRKSQPPLKIFLKKKGTGRWAKACISPKNISPVWSSTRAITPSHFTTDNRNAKVNPSLKKFFEKKPRVLIQHKADGAWRTRRCPWQGLSITLTLPYCRIFLKIITLLEKIFLRSRFIRLYTTGWLTPSSKHWLDLKLPKVTSRPDPRS